MIYSIPIAWSVPQYSKFMPTLPPPVQKQVPLLKICTKFLPNF